MMSAVEQVMLLALADDGTELSALAQGADQLARDLEGILAFVDQVLGRLDENDPARIDLIEIRDAAALAAKKLEHLSYLSCKPNLWLVP